MTFKIEAGNYVELSRLTEEQHKKFYDMCLSVCDEASSEGYDADTSYDLLGIDNDDDGITYWNDAQSYGYNKCKNITNEFLAYCNDQDVEPECSDVIPESEDSVVIPELIDGDIVNTNSYTFVVYGSKLIGIGTVQLGSTYPIEPNLPDINQIKRAGEIIWTKPEPKPEMSQEVVDAIRAYDEWLYENSALVPDDEKVNCYVSKFTIK